MDFPETPAAENPNHVPVAEVSAEAHAPVEAAPVETAPVEKPPVEKPPIEEAPAETAAVEAPVPVAAARSLRRRLRPLRRLNQPRRIRAKKPRASRGSGSAT